MFDTDNVLVSKKKTRYQQGLHNKILFNTKMLTVVGAKLLFISFYSPSCLCLIFTLIHASYSSFVTSLGREIFSNADAI